MPKTLLILLAIFIICPRSLVAQKNQTVEPPLRLVVKIGNEVIDLAEGESAKVSGQFSDPVVTVSVAPFRHFSYGGIKFDYPKEFIFSANVNDADSKMWSMTGENMKLMVFISTKEFTARGFLSEILGDLSTPENVESMKEEANIKLGESTITGPKMKYKLGDIEIMFFAYEIPSENGSRILILQEDGDDNEPGNNAARVRDALQRSFSFK